jgi:hypothetical protein
MYSTWPRHQHGRYLAMHSSFSSQFITSNFSSMPFAGCYFLPGVAPEDTDLYSMIILILLNNGQ